MTSDPKHLPPRDCLVLVDEFGASGKPGVWLHTFFCMNANLQPIWRIAGSFQELDPSRVITWRELPEVE